MIISEYVIFPIFLYIESMKYLWNKILKINVVELIEDTMQLGLVSLCWFLSITLNNWETKTYNIENVLCSIEV